MHSLTARGSDGQRPKSEPHPRKGGVASPGYASARFNLATALAKAGNFDGAADNLRRVLADNPEDVAAKRRLSEVLTLRGNLLLHDGKRDEALAQFDEALLLDPANEDARKNHEQVVGHIP